MAHVHMLNQSSDTRSSSDGVVDCEVENGRFLQDAFRIMHAISFLKQREGMSN